jgi:protein-S-isoprenylcysteine O-methyltransferase Ste14
MKRAVWYRQGWIRLRLADVLLIAVYAWLVRINLPHAWRGDVAVLLLVVQETCIVGLALVRRRARKSVHWESPDALLAWCGTLAPILVQPAHPAPLPWPIVGGMLQLLGQGLALGATLALGRSFDIVAANRGIQIGGLYQYVRHPLYAAYLLAFGGFVVARPSIHNGLLLLFWTGIQIARIHAEERLLSSDPRYAAYAARVRDRLIPGIW